MSLSGKSLMVLVPMYGGHAAGNFIESWTNLVIMLIRYGVSFSFAFTYNESLISRGRNRLADEYLKKHDETHALFVDADIGFQAVDVLALLEGDSDIVAAPCTKKAIRFDRVQRLVRKNGREYTVGELARVAGDFVFNFERDQAGQPIQLGQLQEMRNMGTGLMMIRRNVFESFREAYPDRWFEPHSDPNSLPGPIHDFFRVGINPETREYDSEDYWFCVDCKAIGFKVLMAPWMVTTHKGTYDFIADMPAVAKLLGEL